MEWITDILFSHTAVQAVIVLSALCACGLALGKVKLWGISLGVTFVFFLGILAGSMGISIDQQMLHYAQDFGLVLFVYALGVQVGPGFFNSLHHSGVRHNMLALAVVLLGTAMTLVLPWACGIHLTDAVGILRRHHQHAGAGCCPADVEPAGVACERSGTGVCRHLSAGRGGGHPGAGGDATCAGAGCRHGATRR